ncbi:MAG: hypothetical protein KAJ03_04260 [Gammaproteobacteria bacterium]|nr:hypothetical protein [Gammaproteobacteria bacterium]
MKYKIWDRRTGAFIRGTIDNDGAVWDEYGDYDITDDVDVLYYTGKLDNNGVEFCVGDLVRVTYDDVIIGIVLFGEHCGGYIYGEALQSIGFYVSQLDHCVGQEMGIATFEDTDQVIEIIGNKYENAELMP